MAVALDGAGWHPAAWRSPESRAAGLLTAGSWTDLVLEAERGLLDFVPLEDAFVLQPTELHSHDDRTDLLRGRLDALLVAARVAPHTRHIGLAPSTVVTHSEPFAGEPYALARKLATLDHLCAGRAAWNAVTSLDEQAGANFRVPRSPQGRPPILLTAAAGNGELAIRQRDLAAAAADIVIIPYAGLEAGIAFRADLHERVARHGRAPEHLLVLPAVSCREDTAGAAGPAARTRGRQAWVRLPMRGAWPGTPLPGRAPAAGDLNR